MKQNIKKHGINRIMLGCLCCLMMLTALSLGTGMGMRANAAEEFTGSIEVYGVIDHNDEKVLHVNIPYEFDLGGSMPWRVVLIYIEVTLNSNSAVVYKKSIRDPAESPTHIPLSEIGAFAEYGTYTINVRADYQLVIAIQDPESVEVQCTYEHKDTSVPLPEPPTKEGHTFTGWFFDEECTQAYDGSPIYADTVLYAGFEINRHTVTLNTAGGVVLQPIVLDWGTVPTLPTPTRTGYNFVGWYNGDTEYTGEPIKADTTLTAKWEIKIYTVTFMANGETHKTVDVPHGSVLVDAMRAAGLADYAAVTINGVRFSKFSTITEDTAVLVTELSGAEKFGDYVARNMWLVWTVVGLLGAGVLAIVIMAIVIRQRG